MRGMDVKRFPIQIMVNYWEVKPAAMGQLLEGLYQQGITSVCTFVPWHLFESDISHSLLRFLTASSERKISVTLIPTPEVGVHCALGGLPKDIALEVSNHARHAFGQETRSFLPPKTFAYPSLYHPEVLKKYFGFLSKLNVFLTDLSKAHRGLVDLVSVATSGSYWKYLRDPKRSAIKPFGSLAGDFSKSASLEYRKALEGLFAQKEFISTPGGISQRWKTREYDEVNRRWFHSQSEEGFRIKTRQILERNALPVAVFPIELHTPEADPSQEYTTYLRSLLNGGGDFFALSRLLDEVSCRSQFSEWQDALPYVHWTSISSFRALSDAEKQFLLLKSLLTMGSRGGGIMIDSREWFSFSTTFRYRAERLALHLGRGEFSIQPKALYLTPHLWSDSANLFEDLFEELGNECQAFSSLGFLDQSPLAKGCKLTVVDPNQIITEAVLIKLLQWATQAQGVLAIPKSPLYTESALRLLHEIGWTPQSKTDSTSGIPYQIFSLGDSLRDASNKARVVVFEANPELQSSKVFVSRLLGMGLKSTARWCTFSDSRLKIVTLSARDTTRHRTALFVLNPTGQAIKADMLFIRNVKVGDLASTLTSDTPFGTISKVSDELKPQGGAGRRFSLDVPPCGILPLWIEDGAEQDEVREAPSTTLPPQFKPKPEVREWN